MTLADLAHVSLGDDAVIREVNGESVLLNVATEEYFGLDELSTDFIRVLTSGSNVAEALETLKARYDVDPEVLRRDVEAFVAALADYGLIDVDPAG